jgi:translation factor GUF1, mitochondrial
MIFLLNSKPVDALALIVHRSNQDSVGKAWVKKLREWFTIAFLSTLIDRSPTIDRVIPRQLFEVPIQAVVGRKVIARETLSALRADVTAGLYGGKKSRLYRVTVEHDIGVHLKVTMNGR